MAITIVLNGKEEQIVQGLSNVLGITAEEAVGRCLSAAAGYLKVMTPKVSLAAAPVPEKPTALLKAWAKMDGVLYKNATYKGLLLEVLKGLGCRRVFEASPEEGARAIIFSKRPENSVEENGESLQDGRYHYWVYTKLSQTALYKFLRTTADSLGVEAELPE